MTVPGVAPDTAAAKSRQAYVLDRMRTTGRLDGSSAANAAAEELVLVPELAPPLARHFVQFAREELAALQPSMSDRSGLVVSCIAQLLATGASGKPPA